MNLLIREPRPRVLWVTNVMPPYRSGLWESLGEKVKLNIIAVEGDSADAVKSERSADWLTRNGQNFVAANLSTIKYRRGQLTLHVSRHIIQIFRYVKWCDAVVIGGWESPVYLQFMGMAKILGKPFIIFYESTSESSRWQGAAVHAVKSYIFRSADAVIVPGKASHEAVAKFGVPEGRIFEGFNAVDMTHFSRLSDTINPANEEEGGHKYLYVGRLIKLKRVSLLIREFSACRGYQDSLTIAGKGPELDTLRSLASDLGVADDVFFVGEVGYDALPGLFHAHHTLVLPSDMEVWGLVVNEALSAGLHVVVSRQCGVATSVQSMDGVIVWDDRHTTLGHAMRESAMSWRGPIQEPEIFTMTNEKFAGVVEEGVIDVLERG